MKKCTYLEGLIWYFKDYVNLLLTRRKILQDLLRKHVFFVFLQTLASLVICFAQIYQVMCHVLGSKDWLCPEKWRTQFPYSLCQRFVGNSGYGAKVK